MTGGECPACGKNAVCSPSEARAVYQTRTWGNDALLSEADRVCSFCRAVRIDGQWCDRLQSASERAWQLTQAASKSHDEYVDILGDVPDDKPTASDRGADDAADTDFDW